MLTIPAALPPAPRSSRAPVDQGYGVREYGARDLEGQLWFFQSSLDSPPSQERSPVRPRPQQVARVHTANERQRSGESLTSRDASWGTVEQAAASHSKTGSSIHRKGSKGGSCDCSVVVEERSQT